MAVPSFPQVHTTGPVHHYVRTRDQSSIFYLGTAEVTPQMDTRRFYGDVFNDKAGPALPYQRLDHGEAAMIGVMLTYFSYSALSAMLKAGISLGQRNAEGVGGNLSRGSLVFGQQSFELWQVFDFYGTAQATTGLSQGRYWPQVTLANHKDETTGTSGQKLLCAFDAQPLYTPRNGSNGSAWTLVRWDSAAFPSDVLEPQ